MKRLRFISAVMTIVLVIGLFANLSLLPVFAANNDTQKDDSSPWEEYLKPSSRTQSVEAKLASMKKTQLENDKYVFYIDTYSGEFALSNKITGQTMFSNPYDVGKTTYSETVDNTRIQKQLLSQIIINYSLNGTSSTYTSFGDCVMLGNGQLKVKSMKNGIRVEYSIGREETRRLIPMMISAERFESEILSNIDKVLESGELDRALERKVRNAFYDAGFFIKRDLSTAIGETQKQQMIEKYPAVQKFPLYVFDSDQASNKDKNEIENYIKTYCPDYDFAALAEDYEMVGYVDKEQAPAVFKLALEYSLDDQGLNVRLPANGIRFDESVYTLDNIAVLPWVGAGNSNNNGYVFLPDGSGTIVRFEDFKGTPVILSGKLYGQDYAFHDVAGSTQQIMRMPVYGIVETKQKTRYKKVIDENGVEQEIKENYTEDNGFLAIIEEGDSLSYLTAETGGTAHPYNTAYTTFNPRPSDQYNLSDSISVGSNAQWTVVSDRKYTGSYRIKYVILEDEKVAEEKLSQTEDGKSFDYFEASYVGMAKAYRDYLVKNGQLTPFTSETVKEDIPLYIESFGTIDTTEKFLSFPITVETPLTTFDDLLAMYSDFEDSGINNVNFKLRGFTNGGMYSTVPSGVKFQKKSGGNKGYKEFINTANEKGFGVYPDFDFVNLWSTGTFDGFSLKRDAARTIDDRYTQKRTYSFLFQTLMDSGNIIISASAFSNFYDKFSRDYNKLGSNGISVSTLGSDLNSDFNEDNPYNREDSREAVVEILDRMQKDYGSIMVNAGNAYVYKYADHILEVSLDSSRYLLSSQSIPFAGMVLHGSVNFTGSAMNTIGDIDYEILKIIENGAAPYFMLSCRNTSELKDNLLFTQYYSVRYDIWKEDLIKYYNLLNEALGDVQDATIDDHEFIDAKRVPSEKEEKEDAEALQAALAEAQKDKAKVAEKERRAAILEQKIAAEKAAQLQASQVPGQTAPVAPQTPEAIPATPETPQQPETNEEEEEEVIDLETKYHTELGTVVKVTYSNGKAFILNYNTFTITAEGQTIEPLGFCVVNG